MRIQQTINKLNRQLAEGAIEFDADWYNERIVSSLETIADTHAHLYNREKSDERLGKLRIKQTKSKMTEGHSAKP